MLKNFVDRFSILVELVGGIEKAAFITARSEMSIVRYCEGKSIPRFNDVAQLCAKAGVSLDWVAFAREPKHVANNNEVSTLDLAEHILFMQTEDEPHISPLKLQKLLYFLQGEWLAKNGTPLFNEPIEAWQHGPVIKSVYHAYKNHGSMPIPRPHTISPTMPEEINRFVELIYHKYAKFEAYALADMSHKGPWRDTKQNEEIDSAALRSFFTFAAMGAQ